VTPRGCVILHVILVELEQLALLIGVRHV
jgi:hypothetical protein